MNEDHPSPDGKYMLNLGCNEMRMSLWVCEPILREVATGKILYEAGFPWDASEIKWSEDSSELRFVLRKYPDGMKWWNYKISLPSGEIEVTEDGARG